MRTRVKICGLTRVEDANLAAELGADAIGLVFYPPSPRHVDADSAAKIVRSLPAFVSVVGLFVDAEPEYINEILVRVKIDCLQFHGEEEPGFCRFFGKPYVKAIRMREGTRLDSLEKRYHDACGLLLDAYCSGVRGGSGTGFDWNLIPQDRNLPIILAGGLSPENVEPAIRTVKPYALDVSSGVEIEKGIKDVNKMVAFIRNTNRIDKNL